MIYIRPGSRVHTMLTLFSLVNEFPFRSLHLLGNERVYQKLVWEYSRPQTFCLSGTNQTITTKLFSISGKGKGKTIRIYKKAFPILEWMGELDRYLDATCNHKFNTNHYHVDRNHRIAEVTTMMMRLGMEIHPDRLPPLCERRNQRRFIRPTFYPSKVIKEIGENDLNKTCFSRVVGTLYTEDIAYAVYNTRDMLMKWNGGGEEKIQGALWDVTRRNTNINDIRTAILFGASEEIALQTLMESDRSRRHKRRFDSIYYHIHFIPLSEEGMRQLRILLIPDRKEQILSCLFDDSERILDFDSYEYDGRVDGVNVYVAFDGDLARLIRFRNSLGRTDRPNEVVCFPHQAEFLRQYLGKNIVIKTLSLDVLEKELGIVESGE